MTSPADVCSTTVYSPQSDFSSVQHPIPNSAKKQVSKQEQKPAIAARKARVFKSCITVLVCQLTLYFWAARYFVRSQATTAAGCGERSDDSDELKPVRWEHHSVTGPGLLLLLLGRNQDMVPPQSWWSHHVTIHTKLLSLWINNKHS